MIEAKKHAEREFPKESVGFIINGVYEPQENLSENPHDEFLCKFLIDSKIEAVIHSHPSGNSEPSADDMRGQMSMAIPWGIVPVTKDGAGEVLWFGDQVEKKPLLGRNFVNGVWDCYSLIRDFYKMELGIDIMDFPRDREWWESGQNLYVENFQKAGFKPIDPKELRRGDVILAKIRSRIVNHGGVYLGDGKWMHHLYGKLSNCDLVARYTDKFITHYLRYENNLSSRLA